MSSPSSSGGRGDNLQSSDKEDKSTGNSSLQNKSCNDASSTSTKFDSINSALDSIKDNMMCTDDDDDAIDDFLLADSAEEEKSSMNDTEQLPGSQESSESEELYLVLSDEGETDNPTDTERNCDDESFSVNESETLVKEQPENIDSIDSEKKSDQTPFEETLTCDLHVNENHNNSECSTDSSDLLKLTAEEEMSCPPVSDSILDDDDDLNAKQQSKGLNSAQSSSVVSSATVDTQESPKEQSLESKVGEISTKDTSLCQELRGVVERLKDDDRENMEGSSNSNSSGSNTEVESRSVTDASVNKAQVDTDSGVSSPSSGQVQPSVENSSAAKNKSVSETDSVTKQDAMDISSTLPCGLFKDDSLEEFSLSPKDCQSLKGDGKSVGVEANGLSEAEQGMSIEDIIDNLSSPIEEDACSVADETSKGEMEVTEAPSIDERRANKRAPESDSLSNDKVEVKKVKLDIVFNDKASNAETEDSDETKNATSSASSGDGKQSEGVNGEVTKMEVNCDDDIDIIEEKPPFKREEKKPDEKVDQQDLERKQTPAHTEEKKEADVEVKVNGIATDHLDEDMTDEKTHVTSENVDELVIKRISDHFYEDHINTIVALMKKVETLERMLEKSRKRLLHYQNMLGNLSSEHRRQLAKLGILPKVHTRTVGVNVRILQEHELQSTNRLGMVKSGLVPPATSATPAQSTPVLTNTTMQLAQQPTAKKTIFPRAATPSGLTPGPRMPSPNVTVSQITVSSAGVGNDDKIRAPSSLQIIPSVGNQGGMASPASMMNRPRMQPSILRRQPVPKSPVSATSTGSIMLVSNPALNTSTVASSSSINVIDLTEDADSSLTTTTVTTSQSSAMLVSPSVTRGPSSNLVPMPLVGSVNSVLQLIPSGPHMGSSISGNNAIRVGRPPTVLPNSACLSQGPRVAYVLQQNPGTLVMPRMDGQVSQIGSLQPHQSPFVTSSGQHVPTILVRMNAPPSNPAAATTSNVVSTGKPTVSQGSPPVTLQSGNTSSSSTMLISCVAKHPAPLPPPQAYPENKNWKSLPPRPSLKISKVSSGIVLLWNMSLFNSHAEIATYQLFAYQESNQAVTSSLWKKVGDVKALPLPMACTLTQFVEGHKYHFAVRAVDVHGRIGPFSDPSSIVLLPRSGQMPSK